MGHASPKYTAEFKQRAVQLYLERGGTYAEIGRELGVDPGSVSDWVKRARRRGLRPVGQPLPGRRGEPQAQEGERAAQGGENEILLKASAFFASRQL